MDNPLPNIDVFILCGGKGSRLGNICSNTPKPMLRIGKKPFLEIIIRYLFIFGLRRFILGIGYKRESIKRYFLKNPLPGIEIIFSSEDTPLGTGGAVKKAKKFIQSDNFFVFNGDSFSRFNPAGFFSFHRKKNALVSILLSKAKNSKDFGFVRKDRASHIIAFAEKKSSSVDSLVNCGVYIFNKKTFSLFPRKANFSLEYDFFPILAKKNIFGYNGSSGFIDIGTPKRLLQARHKRWI